MATTVDLKIGLNLEIGSVPVALVAEIDRQPTQTVYTFDGSVQDADVPLGRFMQFVGMQFGVDVALPPELDLDAKIDYVAGQVVLTKPQTGASSTRLGVSGKFDFTTPSSELFTLQFYAGADLQDPVPASGNPYVVGACFDTALPFARLPLVGDVPGFDELVLTSIGFSYTNATPGPSGTAQTFAIPQVDAAPNPLYTGNDPTARDGTVYAISTQGNQQTFALQGGGFSLTAGLANASGEVLDNFALPMALPASQLAQQLPVYYPQPTSPPASPVHWMSVNKTFGPVVLRQIGLNYSDGEASFGFSATFALGGFSLGLQGLTITFPLPLPGTPAGDEVSFGLQGLTFDIQESSFQIGGAFLAVAQNGVTSYYGEVIAQAASFGVKALGGYTPASGSGPASFFLYANVDVPLGGPPFLFVTGLAGGFGINRTLILPTIDGLSGYVLLPANAPPQGASPASTIAAVLPQMEAYFVDQPGEYWVAAGIAFTSFEMIDAFALVTVAFGVDVQVGLLGTCAMTLPTGTADPVAYVEIDILASYTPSSGLLSIQGKLSPASFVYGGFCRLSGGFAFFIWFGGEHEGDFVVSLGGYHPAFTKPDNYPAVPRLTMAFELGPFHVTGQAYFALTPAMLMAGLSMSATWNSGPVKAWFTTGVDFLIAWAPFHYEADAYINVGCSVDLGLLTLDVQVGADLYVWGPPFGGTAELDLDVVICTIQFGAPPAVPPPVGWNTFKTNFLPQDSGTAAAPVLRQARRVRRVAAALSAGAALADDAPATNVIKASVPAGLLQSGVAGLDWIVDPNAFAILTSSTIPANNGQWVSASGTTAIPDTVTSYGAVPAAGLPYLTLPDDRATFSATQVWNPVLNIAAMNQNGVASYHTVGLRKRRAGDPAGTYADFVTTVAATPQLVGSSTALWGPGGGTKTVADDALLDATLNGFLLAPMPRNPDRVSAVKLVELLFTDPAQTGFAYQSPQVATAYTVAATSTDAQHDLVVTVAGAHAAALTNQGYVLSALADPWVAGQRAAIVADLVANGFATSPPGGIDVSLLATRKALTDWPMVELLGTEQAA